MSKFVYYYRCPNGHKFERVERWRKQPKKAQCPKCKEQGKHLSSQVPKPFVSVSQRRSKYLNIADDKKFGK